MGSMARVISMPLPALCKTNMNKLHHSLVVLCPTRAFVGEGLAGVAAGVKA